MKSLLALAISLCLICQSDGATHFISVQDSSYDPNQLAIDVGDTVAWTQDDNTEHTVTSDDNIFNSDTLSPGDSFSVEFTVAGTYPYYCVFHGHGMSGVIVVSEPVENHPPNTPVNISPANNASNQPVAVTLRANNFSDTDSIDFHGASQWIVRNASNGVAVVDSGIVTGSSLTNYSPAGLLEGTVYDWQVRYRDGRGSWSGYSAATRFTTLISVVAQGTGLRASYNNIPDFSSPLIVVTNAGVDFDWGHTRPHRRITSDDFAVRWEGSLLPQFTGLYQIAFEYRGRAKIWVNNQLLIDEWQGCSFVQTRRGTVALVAGQLASVRVDYVADPVGARAILRWTSGTNGSLQVIPTARLFPPAP